MNILALDTSMGVCGAAVLLAGGDAQRTVLCEESMTRGHAEALRVGHRAEQDLGRRRVGVAASVLEPPDEGEQVLLQQDMRQDAVRQIVRRLATARAPS